MNTAKYVRAAQPGDIVEVLVETKPGETAFEKAIVQSNNDPTIYVQYFEKVEADEIEVDGDTYDGSDVVQLSSVVHEAHIDSINRRWQIDDSTPLKLYTTMRAANLAPMPEDKLEYFEVLSSDDEEDASSSLCNFVVSDEDDDCFTIASPTSAFVQDVHAAVNEFERWAPETGSQLARVKEFVQQQDKRAQHRNEDARMMSNKAPETRYNCPPTT